MSSAALAKRTAKDRDSTDITGRVIGNYRVLEKIAEGGVGVTYKGEHVSGRKPVCIKHSLKADDPQYQAIWEKETDAIWDLRHHSIPTVRDLLKLEDGSMAIVMSYIPGETIEKKVERLGRLDPEAVAWITERILNPLRYMHYEGVLHGDLKPQNVIVQEEKHQVVIVDYGLAMIKPGKSDRPLGYTEVFAPPEQMAGRRLLPQSDFYSLGMTMLYMLGGGVEQAQRKEVPEDTPKPLCEFISRLIVRDIDARPDWKRQNLCEEIQRVRQKAFGRIYSGMKPIKGVS